MSRDIHPGACHRFAFGEYELYPVDRFLRDGTGLIALEPKPFDLLVYLVTHRDRIVTKDELLQTLWGDSRVCAGALTQCVSVVRRAVGDGGRTRRVLKTYSKIGYRFIAPVRSLDAEALAGSWRDTHQGSSMTP